MTSGLYLVVVVVSLLAIPVSRWMHADAWIMVLLMNSTIMMWGFIRHKTRWNHLSAISNLRKPSWTALYDHVSGGEKFKKAVLTLLTHLPQIGTDQFEKQLQHCTDEHIRHAFERGHKKIAALKQTEQAHHWITQGVAATSQIKLQEDNLQEYASRVISQVARYVQAFQGAFYRNMPEDGLERIAVYACDHATRMPTHVAPGEGLLGQAVFEKELMYITDAPEGYFRISSGLGQATPQTICILPLRYSDQCYGVLELASFEKFPPYQREYLMKIAEIVGYTLASLENHQQTQRLLEESRQLTEQMMNKEAVLKKNMEQLRETQEAMRRKQQEMDAVLAAMATLELNMEGEILQANDVFLSLTGYKQQDLVGKSYSQHMLQQGTDVQQYELMWASIREGKTFSGEFRMVDANQQPVWMTGNFTPLLQADGIPYKVMMISMVTTQEKEKLLELQQYVNGVRNMFPVAELTPQLTFKSPNEIFLNMLGISRTKLHTVNARMLWHEETCYQLLHYIQEEGTSGLSLELVTLNTETKRWQANLMKIKTRQPVPRVLLIINCCVGKDGKLS